MTQARKTQVSLEETPFITVMSAAYAGPSSVAKIVQAALTLITESSGLSRDLSSCLIFIKKLKPRPEGVVIGEE